MFLHSTPMWASAPLKPFPTTEACNQSNLPASWIATFYKFLCMSPFLFIDSSHTQSEDYIWILFSSHGRPRSLCSLVIFVSELTPVFLCGLMMGRKLKDADTSLAFVLPQ